MPGTWPLPRANSGVGRAHEIKSEPGEFYFFEDEREQLPQRRNNKGNRFIEVCFFEEEGKQLPQQGRESDLRRSETAPSKARRITRTTVLYGGLPQSINLRILRVLQCVTL